MSPRVRESTSQQSTEYIRPTDSAERPTISTQFLRQADVQVLLLVVVLHIINFVHASPPQPSTAVHTYAKAAQKAAQYISGLKPLSQYLSNFGSHPCIIVQWSESPWLLIFMGYYYSGTVLIGTCIHGTCN